MSFAARSLADALPYPAAITDDSGRVLVANDRWRRAGAPEGETLSGGLPDCPGHDKLPFSVRDARPGSDVVLPCRCDPDVAAAVRVTGLESTCGAQRRLVTVESGPAEGGRDRLLGLLGPEIRTPAAAVASAADLLRAQALPAAAQETIDDIQRTARGLETLADDLAELARRETGMPDVHEEPVVLRRVLEDVAESMRGECREKGILLLTAPAPGLPAVVDGDGGVLRRILAAVVGHAVQQSAGGEVVVTAEADGADAYRVEITGDGPAGTGLDSEGRAGLALANRLAATIGGTTTVSAGARGGVAVGFGWAVRLPLRPLPDRRAVGTPPVRGRVAVAAPSRRSTLALSWLVAATGAEPVPADASDLGIRCEASPDPVTGGTILISSTGHRSRAGTLSVPVTLDRLTAALREPRVTPITLEPLPPGRVLLAEDDEVNRTVLQRMISVLGVECDTVSDGVAAVAALLSETRYDLALLDMHMPVMDGLVATRTVRSTGSRMPIIALTATTLSEDQDRCLDAGMNGHLAKPITLPELRRALEPYPTAPAHPAEPTPPASPAASAEPKSPIGPAVSTGPIPPAGPAVSTGPVLPAGSAASTDPMLPAGPEATRKADTPTRRKASASRRPAADPVTSAGRDASADPVTPVNPVTSADAVAPSSPSVLASPVTPSSPSAPANLVAPSSPSASANPVTPSSPSAPASPVTSANPVEPAGSVPVKVLSRAQLHDLEEQLEGRELVAMTVNMFLAELDGRRQTMATALATGGNDRLAAVAHTLKSSSALLGAQPLADACARVERLAATPVDAGVLAAAVSEVDQAATAAAIAMAEYLKES